MRGGIKSQVPQPEGRRKGKITSFLGHYPQLSPVLSRGPVMLRDGNSRVPRTEDFLHRLPVLFPTSWLSTNRVLYLFFSCRSIKM